MTDYYLPAGLAQSIEWELRSNVAKFMAPIGGVTRTTERVGSRWAATFRVNATSAVNAARLRSFLATQRGGANRFWCYDPSYAQRGSFPAPERFTNSDFSFGTTGWTSGASAQYAITEADRSLISTRIAPGNDLYFAFQSAASVVQYAPQAIRMLTVPGIGAATSFRIDTTDSTSVTLGYGLQTFSEVPRQASTTQIGFMDRTSSGYTIGDRILTPFASAARCAFVDNGTNSFLQSDTLQTTWVTNQATVTPNAVAAPDGTTTADNISDNAVNTDHYIGQSVTVSASAADYAYFGSFKGSGITWVQARMATATGDVRVWINLSNGAVGTTTTGSGWSNTRVFVTDQGGGWYRVHVVSRKTSSDTSLTSYVRLATGDAITTYIGVGGGLNAWRVGVSPSAVPSRGAQTTTTASTGTSQTGASLYLKGLPVSTNGLLSAGDWAEVITPTYSELKRVTAPLNTDAAGLGVLQFEPMLRQSPADNAAVIVRKPMVRMLLDESTVKMQHNPGLSGGIMSCTFTAVEDVTA